MPSLQHEQSLRTEQKLILTAQMQQALTLLSLPLLELQDKIAVEAQENPFLDVEMPRGESLTDLTDMAEKWQERQDILWDDDEAPVRRPQSKATAIDGGEYDPFATFKKEESFTDMLLMQLRETPLPDEMKGLCRYVIHSLNNRGYLPYSEKELSLDTQQPIFDVLQAIYAVQMLSPAGVAARSLEECLLLQLSDGPNFNEYTVKIVNDCLELLAQGKIKQIAAVLKLSVAETEEYCQVIRDLNPIPSRGFLTDTPAQYILPEATVETVGRDTLIIHYHSNYLPQISISKEYCDLIDTVDDAETKRYLREHLASAKFLQHSVSQRRNTVERVIEAIVELQKQYFLGDRSALRPMTLESIADALQLHPSTISRAIREKYIICTYGAIPLRGLFNLCVDESGQLGSAAIKERILTLVSREDKAHPLSDESLRAALSTLGINISRRVIAKYRAELRIPASASRRRGQQL